jgi:hypothetical protein
MLSKKSAKILQKILAFLGQSEREIEQERKRLCRHPNFSVGQAFDIVDYTHDGRVGVGKIQDFLYDN